ncbi:Rieske 2Fe-2S domain-containing protein [Aquihabitans sp. G128]|nr:Rieske 2Fe-2S domain-containing protein [Aquihabitans sp. G128]
MAHELGDRPHQVWLLGEPWVLARLDGAVVAFEDRCPHRLAPLSIGSVDADLGLRCGYHGWTFAADGGCTSIPALGEGGAPPAPSPARAGVGGAGGLRPGVAGPGRTAGAPAGLRGVGPRRLRRLLERAPALAHERRPAGRQLPRRLALPVRAHRHVRHRRGVAGGERARRARRVAGPDDLRHLVQELRRPAGGHRRAPRGAAPAPAEAGHRRLLGVPAPGVPGHRRHVLDPLLLPARDGHQHPHLQAHGARRPGR